MPPLCGPDSDNIKSAITPYLSGDIKLDKYRYLTKPVSTEDLRINLRDFFVFNEDKNQVVSLSEQVQEKNSTVEIGKLWHKVLKKFPEEGIEIEALNFVPVTGENVELMKVKVTNVSKWSISITPTSSLPMFCRSLENKHDHEHVTSLLKRTEQLENGVYVHPRMVFNEKGIKRINTVYYVLGYDSDSDAPIGSFPTRQSFIGDKGTLDKPDSVFENISPEILADESLQGKEAVGALRFKNVQLKSGQSTSFYIMIGIADNREQMQAVYEKFNTCEKYEEALQQNIDFWKNKISGIEIRTGDNEFNSWNEMGNYSTDP